MDARGFGEYFRREVKDKQELSASTVGGKIGAWPPGSDNYLNDTGVRRIYEGGRRLSEEFVWHLIRTFDLDENEAWASARVLPEGEGDHESAVQAVQRYRGRHLSVKRGSVQAVEGTTAQQRRTTSR